MITVRLCAMEPRLRLRRYRLEKVISEIEKHHFIAD